jgi:hypothetical protein
MGLLVECPKCGKLNSEKTLKLKFDSKNKIVMR